MTIVKNNNEYYELRGDSQSRSIAFSSEQNVSPLPVNPCPPSHPCPHPTPAPIPPRHFVRFSWQFLLYPFILLDRVRHCESKVSRSKSHWPSLGSRPIDLTSGAFRSDDTRPLRFPPGCCPSRNKSSFSWLNGHDIKGTVSLGVKMYKIRIKK